MCKFLRKKSFEIKETQMITMSKMTTDIARIIFSHRKESEKRSLQTSCKDLNEDAEVTCWGRQFQIQWKAVVTGKQTYAKHSYLSQHVSWCTAWDDWWCDAMTLLRCHDMMHTDHSHNKQGTWTADLRSYSSYMHRSWRLQLSSISKVNIGNMYNWLC